MIFQNVGIGWRHLSNTFFDTQQRSYMAISTKFLNIIIRKNHEETEIVVQYWCLWSSVTCNLSPIEHLWDELVKRIRHRHNSPETLQELRDAIMHEWNNIPQGFIQRWQIPAQTIALPNWKRSDSYTHWFVKRSPRLRDPSLKRKGCVARCEFSKVYRSYGVAEGVVLSRYHTFRNLRWTN
jgi:hypothetical protein